MVCPEHLARPFDFGFSCPNAQVRAIVGKAFSTVASSVGGGTIWCQVLPTAEHKRRLPDGHKVATPAQRIQGLESGAQYLQVDRNLLDLFSNSE